MTAVYWKAITKHLRSTPVYQDIRAYVQSLTELPVKRVINTHSHFDHIAGNGFFDVIYGTAGIARSAKNTMVHRLKTTDLITPLPL